MYYRQFLSVQSKVDSSLAEFIPFSQHTYNSVATRVMMWLIHNIYILSLEMELQVVLKTIGQSDVMCYSRCGSTYSIAI